MERPDVLAKMTPYFPLLDAIKDRELARKVASIWYDVWQESHWKDLGDACFAPNCPGITLVKHVCAVTEAALALADIRQRIFGETIDRDLLIAGALLHDASKALEYEPTDGKPIPTKYRKLYQHGLLGAHKAINAGLPDELIHMIIAHTGKSRLMPQTPEALIVYFVDAADADLHKFKFGEPLTLSK